MKKENKNIKSKKPSENKKKMAQRSRPGMGRDTAQSKKSGKMHEKSQMIHLSILEDIDIAYFELDLNGNFINFNDVVMEKLGYSHEELLGMNFRAYSRPEDVKFLKGTYNEIYRTGKPKTRINIVVVAKDGSQIMVEQSISLKRGLSGGPAGFQIVARDITEQMFVERALVESEEKYRTILDTMEEGLFENDLEGNYTFVNDAACRLMGYDREEMIGMNFKKIFASDKLKSIYKIYNEIYRTGEPKMLMDYEVFRKDGSVRIHQANAALLRDSSNKPRGFRVLARDVTEMKKAEEELRKSEEKYRITLETMNEGLLENDLKGNYTYVNDAACRLTGYSCDELLRMNYRDLIPAERVQYMYEVYHRIYETGNPELLLDYQWTHKNDGSVRYHQTNASLIRDQSGKTIGFRSFVRDVTNLKKAEEALRQSEEKYRMMAENVYDVIWIFDLGMKCTYVSPSIFRITGYTPQEFQRIPADEMVAPDSFKLIMKIFTEEIGIEKEGNANPDRSRTMELELFRKDGSLVWVEVSAAFTRDVKGRITGMLGVTRDISERKESERERARLEEQLTQAQKMESVGRLAGGVAHDFNNMLSVILGYAELIKLNLPEEYPLLADVAEIEKAATRSRDITRQLLAFSRKQIITPMTVDLNNLIRGVEKTLFRLIGEDIELKFSPQDDLCNIKFDPAQMEQVLINLAVNARDAMPNGGKLSIETRKTYLDETYCRAHPDFSPGHYVLMTVSDDGAGMSRETLQHVFEPFFTTKETGRGTGLGLATVYGIIRQNNGFVNVYSEPDKGTIFKIYVPRSMDEGEALKEAEEDVVPSGSGTILLVEDDEMVRNMTIEMLEKIGYTVIPTGDPAEALRLCEDDTVHIDLLITDVVMPGMSGKDLRDRIRDRRPEIRVLFMSGYTSNVIVNRGVLEEGVHFMQKPFSMGDLARNVRDALKSEA